MKLHCFAHDLQENLNWLVNKNNVLESFDNYKYENIK